jgi:hypothetical protein
MFVSPNLGLVVWDVITDDFLYTDLENNWIAVDQHDHSGGKGVQIGTNGIQNDAITQALLAPNSVGTAQLQDRSVTGIKIALGTITVENLAPGLLINAIEAIIGTGVTVRQSHSFTVDDKTSPFPGSLELGAFFISPASRETVTLVGAIVHCATVGSIPSTFSVFTDNGSHGSLHSVPGLTALTPGTGGSFVDSGSYALSNLDRVTVECTNSSVGNSMGCTITIVTEHTMSFLRS